MYGIDWSGVLSIGANAAQIVTGVVAGVLGSRYLWQARKRRLRLERYLKVERKKAEEPGGTGNGLHTVVHLMSYLAMTESQVLEAAFTSRTIKRWTSRDKETGRADVLFFQYDKHGGANRDGSN